MSEAYPTGANPPQILQSLLVKLIDLAPSQYVTQVRGNPAGRSMQHSVVHRSATPLGAGPPVTKWTELENGYPLFIWSDGLVTWTPDRTFLAFDKDSVRPGSYVPPKPSSPKCWWDPGVGKIYFSHYCQGTEQVDALNPADWTSESGEDYLSVTPAILCERCGTHGWWRGNVWIPVTT